MGARTIRPALDVFLFQMMEVCHVGLAAECGIYMLQLPSSVLVKLHRARGYPPQAVRI